MIVYFGVDELAKVAILFYASFFAGVIVMYEGISQISPIYVRVARTLGATDGEIFAKVIVPLAVPHMLTALRQSPSVSPGRHWLPRAHRRPAGSGRPDPERAVLSSSSISFTSASSALAFVALFMDLALRALARRFVSWQERIA